MHTLGLYPQKKKTASSRLVGRAPAGLAPIDTLSGDEYTDQEYIRKEVGRRTRLTITNAKCSFRFGTMSANHLAVDDLIRIPGGEFLMGQADGRDEENPVHRVTVAAFRICRYPVTNAHWDYPLYGDPQIGRAHV